MQAPQQSAAAVVMDPPQITGRQRRLKKTALSRQLLPLLLITTQLIAVK
jgi:hypothetical protein